MFTETLTLKYNLCKVWFIPWPMNSDLNEHIIFSTDATLISTVLPIPVKNEIPVNVPTGIGMPSFNFLDKFSFAKIDTFLLILFDLRESISK